MSKITIEDVRKALDEVFNKKPIESGRKIHGYYFCKGRNKTISLSDISTCSSPECFHCSNLNKAFKEVVEDYPGIGGSPFKVEFNKDFIPSSDENNPPKGIVL